MQDILPLVRGVDLSKKKYDVATIGGGTGSASKKSRFSPTGASRAPKIFPVTSKNSDQKSF
jgi:hypothetical protein